MTEQNWFNIYIPKISVRETNTMTQGLLANVFSRARYDVESFIQHCQTLLCKYSAF